MTAFISELFMVRKKLAVTICPSLAEWISKYMKHYLALKSNKLDSATGKYV